MIPNESKIIFPDRSIKNMWVNSDLIKDLLRFSKYNSS